MNKKIIEKNISLTRIDLERIAENDLGFSGLDISRISSLFIGQVLQMKINLVVEIGQILNEVRYLEGHKIVSSTKNADQFKKTPLKGFMKKHFFDARFILKNIGAHFGVEQGGNKNLDRIIKKGVDRNKSGCFDDEMASFLSYNFSKGATEKRARDGRITGEWIIFQRYKGKNYYLTLAAHDEGDENIYKRVKDAYAFDFPFFL